MRASGMFEVVLGVFACCFWLKRKLGGPVGALLMAYGDRTDILDLGLSWETWNVC